MPSCAFEIVIVCVFAVKLLGPVQDQLEPPFTSISNVSPSQIGLLETTVANKTSPSTTISCVPIAVFPQSSVAIQVRTITPPQSLPFGVKTSLNCKSRSASQLSTIPTFPGSGKTSPAEIVMSKGIPEICGEVLSVMVMICVLVATLPHSSSAVHVRVIIVSQSVMSVVSV